MNLSDTIRVKVHRAKKAADRHIAGARTGAQLAAIVGAMAAAASGASAAPITVSQATPVYNEFDQSVELYQNKTVEQSGIELDSAVDGSYAGLLDQVWNLTDLNGNTFNQDMYADFDAFVAGRNFNYTIIPGDDQASTGWSANTNADYSVVDITNNNFFWDRWGSVDGATPMMNTVLSFDLGAIDRNYDGQITPGLEGIELEGVVQDGFVGYMDAANQFQTQTQSYNVIPEPTTFGILGIGALASIGRLRNRQHGHDIIDVEPIDAHYK